MCGFRQTQWMTNNIIKYLKDRSKLTKYFYKNGHRESHHDKLLSGKSLLKSILILAKNENILKVTNILQDPNTASKTY